MKDRHLDSAKIAEYHGFLLPDGEALEMESHASECMACQARLWPARFEPSAPPHPGYIRFERYVLGALGAQARASFERHLESCPDCQIELDDVRKDIEDSALVARVDAAVREIGLDPAYAGTNIPALLQSFTKHGWPAVLRVVREVAEGGGRLVGGGLECLLAAGSPLFQPQTVTLLRSAGPAIESETHLRAVDTGTDVNFDPPAGRLSWVNERPLGAAHLLVISPNGSRLIPVTQSDGLEIGSVTGLPDGESLILLVTEQPSGPGAGS